MQNASRAGGKEVAHVDSMNASEPEQQRSERRRTFVDTLWRTRRAYVFRYFGTFDLVFVHKCIHTSMHTYTNTYIRALKHCGTRAVHT